MPPLYRILEVALYSILNFLPYIMLALYPFRERYRFSKKITIMLIAAITAVQICLGVLAAFSETATGLLSLASTVIYAAFYFTAVKAHFGKTLFTLLMLSNIANFIASASKCIEGILAYEYAVQSYRFTFSAVMVFIEILFLIPLFFYIKNTYTDIFEIESGKPIWRYLWLIPATFYFIWFYHLYAGEHGSSLETALEPNHSVFLLIVNLGALLIYYIVVRLIRSQEKNIELEAANHQLAMQNLQYENLRDRINEARQAKHDIRHHITVMDGYLTSGELDKLKAYLNSYKKALPDDSSILFCKHYATNALLLYFAQQAKNNKIDFDVVIADIPEHLGLPDNILSVVLGNLLENALEACVAVNDRPRCIKIKVKTDMHAIIVDIENTYTGELLKDKDGYYLSTKQDGRGIGLQSVRSIVNQYDGFIEIKQKNNMFCVSVFMNIPK